MKKNKWSIKFGSVKSIDISAVIYKTEMKKNPYIRNVTWRKQKSINHKNMTNAEAY